jgi:hypothetical protein
MEVNDRFKKIIFKKLAKDLSHVEVIPYKRSIWFIDRDKKYWYLELENDGALWYREEIFDRFFQAFSLEHDDYEPIIAEWVEEVLNHRVNTIGWGLARRDSRMEEVLNHKVNTIERPVFFRYSPVERILKSN